MSNPLQNDPGHPQRRSTGEKILAVVDVIMRVCEALLSMFGRRKTDKQ